MVEHPIVVVSCKQKNTLDLPKGAKGFRYRASIHHPLGFKDGTPLKVLEMIWCTWKMLSSSNYPFRISIKLNLLHTYTPDIHFTRTPHKDTSSSQHHQWHTTPPSFGSIKTSMVCGWNTFKHEQLIYQIPIGSMYVWYIYLHEWLIFDGISMKVNIPFVPWIRRGYDRKTTFPDFFKLKFECKRITSPTLCMTTGLEVVGSTTWQSPRVF